MQCPKCKHVQRNSVECESCGLIFAKYKAFQEKKKQEQELREQARTGGSGWLKYGAVVLLVMATAGVTYYFAAPHNRGSVAVSTLQDTGRAETEAAPETQNRQTVQAPAARAVSQDDDGADFRPGDPLGDARRATVMIKTPWSTGSGFFVNRHYIVTNRHVVEFDEAKLAEFKEKIEQFRKLIELERQKIEQMYSQLRRLPKGPSHSQLQIIIDSHEKELAKVLPQYEEGQRRLDDLDRKIQPSDIKIRMADGSEFEANYLLLSEKHDLALMSLFSGEYDYIHRAPKTRGLQQGDKVYAIGSPYGLEQTVTSGIISGSRQDPKTGEKYLQTDAALNPGNSGGPLIDEDGYVRGVNTLIINGSKGIGFSIPIDLVFEEFNSALF